jgi:hypothetical protein
VIEIPVYLLYKYLNIEKIGHMSANLVEKITYVS